MTTFQLEPGWLLRDVTQAHERVEEWMAKSKTLVINTEHVCEALTQYLHALAMLDKNMEVTSFKKSPEGLEIKVAD